MRKFVTIIVAASLTCTAAVAQVRPQDCRPIFPLVDQVAEVVPADVIADPAAPVAEATRRSLFGLPLLLPLLAAVGGGVIVATSNDDNDPVSPA